MKTQQIEQIVSILGEALVMDTFVKLVQIEKEKCLRKIEKLKLELSQFEKKFDISSEDAWIKYQIGEFGDDFDVMEWMALFENLLAFKGQYERISNSGLL
ncbi:conserved hypothetical protein [Candidatus Magnetomoraceae bacterium gMMP-15]